MKFWVIDPWAIRSIIDSSRKICEVPDSGECRPLFSVFVSPIFLTNSHKGYIFKAAAVPLLRAAPRFPGNSASPTAITCFTLPFRSSTIRFSGTASMAKITRSASSSNALPSLFWRKTRFFSMAVIRVSVRMVTSFSEKTRFPEASLNGQFFQHGQQPLGKRAIGCPYMPYMLQLKTRHHLPLAPEVSILR